jgi:hypothetical protein
MRDVHHSGRYAFTIFAQFKVEANDHDNGKRAAWVQIHPRAINAILDSTAAGPDLRPANGATPEIPKAAPPPTQLNRNSHSERQNQNDEA